MPKKFNVTGICIPEQDYMVDISKNIDTIITDYIRKGKYFTISRARQYGKTTLLYLLERRLKAHYIVIRLSFEAADELFVSLYSLAAGLVRIIGRKLKQQNIGQTLLEDWNQPVSRQFPFDDFSGRITSLCENCEKKIILIIDEVDKSSDNQVFLSFLGLLRNKYLEQMQKNDNTFQSVILSGVYDIKNLKIKLHPEQEPKYNSPWNIAADFTVNMDFMPEDIAAMLAEYEADYHTGMNTAEIGKLIYDYTSGYPYLVSRLCQLTDERLTDMKRFCGKQEAWTAAGIAAAELLLRREANTLFDDMVKKLTDYPELKKMLQDILFCGTVYPFNRNHFLVNLGLTFGFLKESDGNTVISNRIFETELYDLFLSEAAIEHTADRPDRIGRNQFIVNGMLQMQLVMEKFYDYFTEIYSGSDQKLIEKQGRKIFLLYLKPIINGTGNYYIEAQTRDSRRTDIIIDYYGKQHIIKLKIWHGNEYEQRGQKQLFEYLDYYKCSKGYMLSFNFNKNKKTGIQNIRRHGKQILEVIV